MQPNPPSLDALDLALAKRTTTTFEATDFEFGADAWSDNDCAYLALVANAAPSLLAAARERQRLREALERADERFRRLGQVGHDLDAVLTIMCEGREDASAALSGKASA